LDSTATSSNCSTKLTNTITDCEFYSGTLYNSNTTSYPNRYTCLKCKKSYYIMEKTTSTANVSASCSSSKGTGCTGTIDNSLQTVCYNYYDSTNSATFSSQFANICKNGYLPVENDIWDLGALKCVKGTPNIANCRYLYSTGKQNVAAGCSGCNKNFSKSSYGYCVGYTTDENCREVNSSDEGCVKCWFAYYFSGTTCTLYSQLLLLQFISLFGLLAFFY